MAQQIESLWNGLRDDNGDPYSGAVVKAYAAGTSTPKMVWQDRAKTLPTTAGLSQFTLDSNGRYKAFGSGTYKFHLFAPEDTGFTSPTELVDGAQYGFGDGVTAYDDYSALQLAGIPTGEISVDVNGKDSAGDGDGGSFYWDSSDLSTEVTADTDSYHYVPPGTDTTGASGAWVRKGRANYHYGPGAPNIIDGYSGNLIPSGTNVRANVISGGGYSGNINKIDGDETRYASIGGGYDNHINGVDSTTDIDGAASTIAGGAHNEIKCTHATIGGGSYGVVGVSSDYGTVAGGTQNEVQDNSQYSTIGGGLSNNVTGCGNATIAGGINNVANGTNATVGGGSGNTAGDATNSDVVTGGVNNSATGGNSAVLGGTTNTASGQGAVAWGRSAVASGRGALCFSSDDADGSQGYSNAFDNTAVFRFRDGYRHLGNKFITALVSSDGGQDEYITETSVDITATTSVDFPDTVASNSLIVGVQLRVDVALATGERFDVAYSGGATQSIGTNVSEVQNSMVNKWFDPNAATPITSATTSVTITKNGGGSFTAQGSITAQIRWKKWRGMDSV